MNMCTKREREIFTRNVITTKKDNTLLNLNLLNEGTFQYFLKAKRFAFEHELPGNPHREAIQEEQYQKARFCDYSDKPAMEDYKQLTERKITEN